MCDYFLSILSILELTVDTYWIFHAIPHPSPLLSYFCQLQIHPFSAGFTDSVRKGYQESKRQDEGRRDFCPRLLAVSCSTPWQHYQSSSGGMQWAPITRFFPAPAQACCLSLEVLAAPYSQV